jgi:hypothetical protein
MKTVIHVNRQNLARNRKGESLPVFTAKDYKQNRRGTRVEVLGPSTFVYSPEKPLKCGAIAWVETDAEVRVS